MVKHYGGVSRVYERWLSCLVKVGVLYFVTMIVISRDDFGVAFFGQQSA